MFKKILNLFKKFETKIRSQLDRHQILFTLFGGVAIVLFWRGVWHTADILQVQGGVLGFLFYGPVNLLIVLVVLVVTGLFVSYFIGDILLMSGQKHEEKIEQRTEKEVEKEEAMIGEMKQVIKDIKGEVENIKDIVEHDHDVNHVNKEKNSIG